MVMTWRRSEGKHEAREGEGITPLTIFIALILSMLFAQVIKTNCLFTIMHLLRFCYVIYYVYIYIYMHRSYSHSIFRLVFYQF